MTHLLCISFYFKQRSLLICHDRQIAFAGGVMGLRHPPQGGKEVPLYYSNPDIIYANEFPAPRFGQGCFAAALNAVYAAVRLVIYHHQLI